MKCLCVINQMSPLKAMYWAATFGEVEHMLAEFAGR